MDLFLARTMVESLSKGIDPLTGCVLPNSDICAREEVQEALLAVLEHCSIESNEQYLVRLKEETRARRKAKRAWNAQRFPRGGAAWSGEEENRLLSLYRNGCSIYEIAIYLKRPPNVVSRQLQVLRGRPVYRQGEGQNKPPNAGGPWTVAEEKQLRAEFMAGMPMKAIAQEHGRTQRAIRDRLNRLRLK